EVMRVRPPAAAQLIAAHETGARAGPHARSSTRYSNYPSPWYGLSAERKRSTERSHPEARAEPARGAVVAAVEGALVSGRGERHPGRGARSSADLEDVFANALPLVL
ncbi:MAG: hypothetical protein QOK49_1369, partial [Baekduia sp.]|nr:hypothetical protein [Baekduia sp.]